MQDRGLMELVEDLGIKFKPEESVKDFSNDAVDRLSKLGFTRAGQEAKGKLAILRRNHAVRQRGYILVTEDAIKNFMYRKAEVLRKECVRNHHGQTATEIAMSRSSSLMSSFASMVGVAARNSLDQGFRQLYEAPSQADSPGDVIPGQFFEYQDETQLLAQQMFQQVDRYYQTYYEASICCGDRLAWKEANINRYAGIPPKSVLDALEKDQEHKLFDFYVVSMVDRIKDPIIFGRFEGSSERYFIPGTQWGEDIQLDELLA